MFIKKRSYHVIIATFFVALFVIFLYLLITSSMRSDINIIHSISGTQHQRTQKTASEEINEFIDQIRSKIDKEMTNYNVKDSNVSEVEDLSMELGGNPVRTLIISRSRSGSSFLGGVISARSPHFYSYEPLVRFASERLEGDDLTESLSDVRNILTCDFQKVKKYMMFLKRNPDFFVRNSIYNYCLHRTHVCYNIEFVTKLCGLFPFQTLKTIRLYLHQVEDLFKMEQFNLRAVLLVRDPRAVMASRWKINWCLASEDCWRAKAYCEDLLTGYRDAERMAAKYPGKITVVRYEDLAREPETTTRRLFKSIGVSLSPAVEDFVRLHTRHQAGGPYSLFRKSADVPFRWTKELSFDVVEDIQNSCREAMSLWGYQPALNASHLKNTSFRPVTNYAISV